VRHVQPAAHPLSAGDTPRTDDGRTASGDSQRDADRAAAVARRYGSPAAASAYADLHHGRGPSARYFHSRLHAVLEALRACEGGELLDVGCGPGMLIRRLATERPGDFRITACDQSPAMLAEAVRAASRVRLTAIVAQVEQLPMATGSFDAVVATGLLEYTNRNLALREISRVVRPGGLVLLSMLNPLSPYRLFEWGLYWPLLRRLGGVEAMLGVPAPRRHGAVVSGIRATPAFRLARAMRAVNLHPYDSVYYDLNAFVPPIDRFIRQAGDRWRDHPERTVGRGMRGWMGTAYLIAARAER
jgi:ubiquinone/menaquinone biosynthesis C-methylase UbiE